MSEIQTVYLLLGSNLQDRKKNITKALELLQTKVGTMVRVSPLYETVPWGTTQGDNFLNGVVEMHCSHDPQLLLDILHAIEDEMGRKRDPNLRYAPRIIDIDILFYADRVISQPGIVIPHPLLHLRRFVLIPLHDLIPDFVHPILKKTVRQLLMECEDNLSVYEY